jgi:hypothetical protein
MTPGLCKICRTNDQTQFYKSRKYICKACHSQKVLASRKDKNDGSDEITELKTMVRDLSDKVDAMQKYIVSDYELIHDILRTLVYKKVAQCEILKAKPGLKN